MRLERQLRTGFTRPDKERARLGLRVVESANFCFINFLVTPYAPARHQSRAGLGSE